MAEDGGLGRDERAAEQAAQPVDRGHEPVKVELVTRRGARPARVEEVAQLAPAPEPAREAADGGEARAQPEGRLERLVPRAEQLVRLARRDARLLGRGFGERQAFVLRERATAGVALRTRGGTPHRRCARPRRGAEACRVARLDGEQPEQRSGFVRHWRIRPLPLRLSVACDSVVGSSRPARATRVQLLYTRSLAPHRSRHHSHTRQRARAVSPPDSVSPAAAPSPSPTSSTLRSPRRRAPSAPARSCGGRRPRGMRPRRRCGP